MKETEEEFYSKNPNGKSLNTWDEIFEFQARKDGANYTLLKEWLKQHYELPQLKDGVDDVSKEKETTLVLNEKASKKLEYITGAGFIRDFPNSNASPEWVGAVLDFLEETNVIKIR